MNKIIYTCIVLLFACLIQANNYNWKNNDFQAVSHIFDIKVPDSHQRSIFQPNSFADWLRQLPLKAPESKVHTFSGELKSNQDAHYALLDIDVGDKDLQQCADAVIRLRAEFLYAMKRYDEIRFNFTSGDSCSFRQWINGMRPYVSINKVKWKESEEKDSSYQTFRNYLNRVFMYAGSYSLEKELLDKATIENIEIGDVFIQGGFPGHAVIVVDVAENNKTGERLFLLAQSYMPAQDIHILKNPNDSTLSPWYSVNFGNLLKTPEWIFTNKDLHSFK
ncbi:MAG: hypothetical protein DWP97_06230 [Calditrichaeota bacterium]|nr:MAG: hypothetical protein DWP97_06230 [Calditrichota bacterium]